LVHVFIIEKQKQNKSTNS